MLLCDSYPACEYMVSLEAVEVLPDYLCYHNGSFSALLVNAKSALFEH